MKKLMFAIAAAAAGAASAAVSFSYQGALRTADGGPIPASESTKEITFRLYDTPAGEDALWGRLVAVHLDTNGLFNVELSDTTGSDVVGVKTNDLAWVLSENAGQDKALYIGLMVKDSKGEIRPRQKLLHVPTAAFAADVTKAKRDFTVDGIATFNGVTTAKNGLTVEGGALKAEKGLTVNGGELTAEKGLNIKSGSLTIGANITINRSGDPAQGIIPRGVIVMWSGAADKVPEGWVLCDGNNGTPNLKERFIVGAGGKYAQGTWGGEESVTLTEAQTPLRWHTHGYWGNRLLKIDPEGSHWIQGAEDKNHWTWNDKNYNDSDWWSGHNSWRFATTPPEQVDKNIQAHNNIPPYYALCFIMKK